MELCKGFSARMMAEEEATAAATVEVMAGHLVTLALRSTQLTVARHSA